MIFQRRAKRYDCNFYIGNEKIDIVQSYTYLGTQTSSTGNFDFSSLKPSLACKIFDRMISPILTYNSGVWGLFIKSDFKYWDTSPIEKGHLQFCKRYLQVNNRASDIACRLNLADILLSLIQIKEFLNTLAIFKVRNKAL